ncbi:hypothetical protein SARC_11910 [Sphaeroforma arctica JP610]|uniref:Uncharacterized protein n=1 Tax=Sphaeroforma arctica JP610 TaxID=667725 RepID=A0A0L0FFN4_9EUKA|nr:hypothetical protein SARC_11910 [Sphaeroforma arctica JP610]KNC75569.1 hypothetical protein SARC_11910 [Sphaeroforma arctica JP610]|eukprot:XP_014149471.1 hypothetical protein SARC_11910 [Sphaeroforma arctica JP610]
MRTQVNKCKAKVEKQGRLVAATTQKVKTAQDKFQDLRQKATYDPIYGVRVDRAQQYFQVKTQVQDNIGALQADLSNKYLTVEQSR